jgi:hypothetical protein
MSVHLQELGMPVEIKREIKIMYLFLWRAIK